MEIRNKKNPGDRPGFQWTLRASFFSSCCFHSLLLSVGRSARASGSSKDDSV